MSRTLGAAGLQLIQSFEQLRLIGYLDEGGVPTAGWGHTGPDVVNRKPYSMDQAVAWLQGDVQHTVAVLDGVVPITCTQNQFDACVSLAFNIGVGAFIRSTLLSKLQAGDIEGAADQFLVWDHVNGQVSDGLARRRAAERALFLAA